MSFGLTDILGNVSGYPNVTVYGADGKLKVVGGAGGGAVWGSITGTITAQTDLITYLSTNYVPVTRNITINGTTYDLSADRTWTIPAGGTVTSVQLTAGTGISLSGTNPITTSGNITVTNSAPDQTVVLTAGTGISVSGTYPSFTIDNSLPFNTPLTTKGDIYVRNASADTRLPVGLDTQVLLADSTTATGLKWGSNTAPTPLGYYGAWQDNVTQTAAASNTGYAMIFRTVDLSNGVTVVTNGTNLTRITFANTGIYNLQFSSQFQNTSNQLQDVSIWLRLNGNDVAGSTGYTSIPNSHGGVDGHSIVSWNYLLSVVAGDYYELVWSTTLHTAVTMQYYAAGSPPPATASVILTVTQQSGIMAGTGITAINSLTGAVQTITAGTSGTDFAVSSSGTTHTLNLPTASATNRGALSTSDWSTFNGKENVLTFSSPLSRATNTISIPAATGSVNGYLTSSDWTNFNTAYTNRITSLTTTGSSGSATLISNVLNVPTYTLAGLGGQPQLNGTGFVKATGTTISYDNSTYLTAAITSLNSLTGATQTFATGTTGTDFAISSAGTTHTFNLPTASASNTGKLSSTDWSTFNGKIGGSGTTNEIAYFTAGTTLGSLTTATYPSLTELSYVKGVTSSIQTQINSLGGSYNAYTMKANNTASSATPSNFTFKDLGDQALPTSPTWSGTAPSGTVNNRYRWFQIGNVVHYHFSFTYTTAGTSNTTMSFTHPSDMPVPAAFTGVPGAVAAPYFLYRVLSYASATLNIQPPTGWYGGLKVNSTGPTVYGWAFSGTAVNLTNWSVHGTYYT